MIIFNKGADFELMANPSFYNSTKGIPRCSFWKWKLRVAVRHAFRANEDEVNSDTVEQVAELHPCLTRERGLGSCAKNEDTHWWRIGPESLDI